MSVIMLSTYFYLLKFRSEDICKLNKTLEMEIIILPKKRQMEEIWQKKKVSSLSDLSYKLNWTFVLDLHKTKAKATVEVGCQQKRQGSLTASH